MKRGWEPAPPDPGITPGGIRDRAMQTVLARGPRPPETPEELRRAQEFWAKYRAEQAKHAAEGGIAKASPMNRRSAKKTGWGALSDVATDVCVAHTVDTPKRG